MTDKETSLAFVERIRTLDSLADLTIPERVDLLRLAETAALIDEHKLDVLANKTNFIVTGATEKQFAQDDLHTAVRAVADKIKEGK